MLFSLLSRTQRRRLWLGLKTLLGAQPAGFFIPYRYAAEVTPPASYEIANALCAAARPEFQRLLAMLNDYGKDLAAIDIDAAPPAPRWRQDWFAPLDAAMLYALIRARRPARLTEIGSGHSTRFAARAIADGGLATQHVAIDPAPRADIDALPLTLHRCVLARADPGLFAGLQAGDILFIDSSHILMPGTDVDQLFNRVLPALAPGVIVHVHDIFLPDDYPATWHWRGYNEQSALLPFLAGGAFRLIFASHYAATRMTVELAATPLARLPSDISAAPATSYWLERR
jgi:hypothetical protein